MRRFEFILIHEGTGVEFSVYSEPVEFACGRETLRGLMTETGLTVSPGNAEGIYLVISRDGRACECKMTYSLSSEETKAVCQRAFELWTEGKSFDFIVTTLDCPPQVFYSSLLSSISRAIRK